LILNLNLFSRFPLYAKNRKMGKRQLELGGFGSSAAIIAAAISTAKDHPLD
jgi:homoserine kinase